MAFVLPPDTALGEALQVALDQQLAAIAKHLAKRASVDGVHRSRKSCKRGRAIADLLSGPVGAKRARKLDRAIRDVARPLGPVRDSDVMRIRLAELGRTDRDPGSPDREAARERALHALEKAQERAGRLDLARVRGSELVDALARSWRRARDRMEETGSDGEAIHDWRKACKALGYQVQLLSERAPDALQPLIAPLDGLQEVLGDHHDHFVLAELFADDAELVADADARQEVLLEEALLRGRVLFAARPADLAAWAKAVWR